MGTNEPLKIIPSDDLADILKKKLQSGESAIIHDGLRALLVRDRAVDNWLVQQVVPAWDALKADPSRALSPDEVRARLAAAHAKVG